MTDTIFALATAPGRAAVAVVRISGPVSRDIVTALAGRAPGRRGMRLAGLRDGAGQLIDRALVLWFEGPGSYTGEDVAEFHLHGGPAVIEALEAELLRLGLRPAEPGEFTRRAFENGKLDLAQAEAVADLIDAHSAAQRRQALGQLDGALSRRHEIWRVQLLEVLALLEANVDFPDEELPEDLAARARPHLEALVGGLEAALADARRGERVRDGFTLAIVGAPNAGKSSLFNALVGRDAAIVTATAGTTRDVIEAHKVIAGFDVRIADTAGVRETTHDIEAEGVRRARAWATAADLRLWLVDASADDGSWAEAEDLVGPGDVCVLNKTDRPEGADGRVLRARRPDAIEISVATGQGLDVLAHRLEALVRQAMSGAEFPAVTRERHRRLLEDAYAHADRALDSIARGSELAAEDVRLAARALERIAGRIDPEDVLGRVFAQFCIGK